MEPRAVTAVRTFFAILAALVTIVAVVAIKRGTMTILSGWSEPAVVVFDAAIILPALAVVIWVYLLRPLLERRQQR